MSEDKFIAELIQLCINSPDNVEIGYDAKHDAARDFKLSPESEIKAFIANNGLENAVIENSAPLHVWKDGTKPTVFSYAFYSEGKKGYLAFYNNPKTRKLFIKSFKYHFDQDLIELAKIRQQAGSIEGSSSTIER